MEILLVFRPINEAGQEGTRFLRVFLVSLLVAFEDCGRLDNAPIPIRRNVNGSRGNRGSGSSWGGRRSILLCRQLGGDVRKVCDPLSKRGEIIRQVVADTSGPLLFPCVIREGCSICVIRIHKVSVFPIRGDDLPIPLINIRHLDSARCVEPIRIQGPYLREPVASGGGSTGTS